MFVKANPPIAERGVVVRGAWAIADQALFACTNLVATALAARWLSGEGFSTFSVAFALVWLIGTFHSALLGDPLLVLGAPLEPDSTRPLYLQAIWRLHMLLACVLLAIALGICTILAWNGRLDVGLCVIGVAIAAAGTLLTWLARKACLLLPNPRPAVVGTFVYLASTVIALALLRWADVISPASVLSAMGLTGWLIGSTLMRWLRVPYPWNLPAQSVNTRVAMHWGWGRWTLSTAVLAWVPANLPYVMMPYLGSLSDVGQLRVLATVVAPMAQVNVAVEQMLTPMFTRTDSADSLRLARYALVSLAGASIVYWIACGVTAGVVIPVIFGAGYEPAAAFIWPFGALPLLSGLAGVLLARLRARGHVARIFFAFAAAAATAVALGGPAILAWRLAGAVLSVLGAYIILLLFLAVAAGNRARHDGRKAL